MATKQNISQSTATPFVCSLYINHLARGMGVHLNVFGVMWAQVSRARDVLERALGGSKPNGGFCGSLDSPPEGSGCRS